MEKFIDGKLNVTKSLNSLVMDYCKDHYYQFDRYPGDMEVYAQDSLDGKPLVYTLDEMLKILTEEQKEIIENQ